jgi:hypothetical protein
MINEIPQIRIYVHDNGNRIDIPLTDNNASYMWMSDEHKWEIGITLNQIALTLGFSIEEIRIGNCIKFKGQGSLVTIWNVRSGEQISIKLYSK